MKKRNYPKISVITPSFNQGKFIQETIESVLSQNYPNLEYFIIDGGSTDKTLKILKSYGNKIRWLSEKDKGQTNAINNGLKKVTGDIISYINSDDVYLPNTFNTVAEFFMRNEETQWLSGDYFIIDEKGKKIQSYIASYKKLLRRNPTFNKLAIANYVIQPSTFWRRSLLKNIGLFDESLYYCMDYDYWMRIIQKYPLHVLDNHFSLFRLHQQSKGGENFVNQFREEHQIVKKYVKNPFQLLFHRLHAAAIVLAYKLIKKI